MDGDQHEHDCIGADGQTPACPSGRRHQNRGTISSAVGLLAASLQPLWPVAPRHLSRQQSARLQAERHPVRATSMKQSLHQPPKRRVQRLVSTSVMVHTRSQPTSPQPTSPQLPLPSCATSRAANVSGQRCVDRLDVHSGQAVAVLDNSDSDLGVGEEAPELGAVDRPCPSRPLLQHEATAGRSVWPIRRVGHRAGGQGAGASVPLPGLGTAPPFDAPLGLEALEVHAGVVGERHGCGDEPVPRILVDRPVHLLGCSAIGRVSLGARA